MKNNLTDTINAAKKESEYNDKNSHSKKVRELANEYMSNNNVDTLDTFVGKHKVIFHKGNSDKPESITITVDGKNYSGSLMDEKICELDHIGIEHKKDRDSIKKKDKAKDNVKATSRIVKVDITRKVLNVPFSVASEGNSLLQTLLRLAGHTINKAMQRR